MSDRQVGEVCRDAVRLFRAIGNAQRARIILHLDEVPESSVGELQVITGLSQSAVSQHLARLRHAGVVTMRKERQTVYYRRLLSGAGEFIRRAASVYAAVGQPAQDKS